MLRSRRIFSIKSADEGLDTFIRASSILGSLHIVVEIEIENISHASFASLQLKCLGIRYQVEELVLNSIDAGATDIKVDIHLPSILASLDDIPHIVIHDNGKTHTFATVY